jgi:hypothetical protein
VETLLAWLICNEQETIRSSQDYSLIWSTKAETIKSYSFVTGHENNQLPQQAQIL